MLETTIISVNKPVYLGCCHISLDNHVNGQPCAGKYPDQLHRVMDNHKLHPDVADTCFLSWMKPTSKPPWSLRLRWICAVLDETHDRYNVSPARVRIFFLPHLVCHHSIWTFTVHLYKLLYTCISTCPWLSNKATCSTSTGIANIIDQPLFGGTRIWVWNVSACIPGMIKLSYVIKYAAIREELVIQEAMLHMRIHVTRRYLMGGSKLIHWNISHDKSLTRQ